MRIYLIRHGETDWNREGRIQGRRDIALNERGEKQAMQAAQVLAGKRFAALITSPLVRAKKTGALLCRFAEVGEVREDERLLERDFGELDGEVFQESFRALMREGKVKGLEELSWVRQRMLEAVTSYAHTYEEDVIVVSHGAALRELLQALDEEIAKVRIQLKNVSFSVLEWQDEAFRVIACNLEAAQWRQREEAL